MTPENYTGPPPPYYQPGDVIEWVMIHIKSYIGRNKRVKVSNLRA